MEIMSLSKNQYRFFVDFVYYIYKNDDLFCDSILFNLKTLLYKKNEFAKSCEIVPFRVENNGQILAQCLLIDSGEDFLSLSYFDALPDCKEAVDMLLDFAKARTAEKNKKELVIGLNGHLSYGVGILQNEPSSSISFDSLYNKAYYKQYFEGYSSINLHTYCLPYENRKDIFNKFKGSGYTVRKINLKKFDSEMRVFQDLCNRTLIETTYYRTAKKNHFFELLSDLKTFLKEENILFLCNDGTEIGFLFWHPDYNSYFCKGKKNNLMAIGLRYLLFKNIVKVCKINAIGILPEFQSGSGFFVLLAYMCKLIKYKYENIHTTFVWESNTKSLLPIVKSNFEIKDSYKVYTWKNHEN